MIHFKQTVLSKIKSASDDHEVEHVVDVSIQRLKDKNVNGHIIQRFIVAMDTTLSQAKIETPGKAGQNIDVAVDLFRKLQRP